MGTTLSGKQINQTYDGLIKTTDNDPITSEKKLTDGLGYEIPMFVSQSGVRFTGVVNFTSSTFVGAPWALSSALTALEGEVDTNTANILTISGDVITNTTDILTISGDVITNTTDILTISGDVITNTANISTNATNIGNEETARITADGVLQGYIDDLEAGVGNVIGLNTLTGDLTLSAGTNVSITNNGTDTITISASGGGGGGAVDDVNGLTGSITLSSTDNDYLTITEVGNDIQFEVLEQRTITEDVKNTTASTLTKGTPVHITGSTGNEAEVIPADASTGLAAHLVLDGDITSGGTGKAVAVGFINNVSIPDTTNFQPGTEVYLADGGGFTHIRPDGTSIVQYLGVVVKSSTTSGAGTISGIIQNLGKENELPNLPQNYIWLGDSNGVPQAVDFAPYTGDTGITWSTSGLPGAIGTYDTNNTITPEGKLFFENSYLDILSTNSAGGMRLYGGVLGAVSPTISTSGSFTTINIDTNLVMSNQNRIAFDSDFTNTYIAADTDNPENLEIHADNEIQFFGDVVVNNNLSVGTITDVEQAIIDLQDVPVVAPIVNETATILIEDDTYNNKFIVFSGASSIDIEIDSITTWSPTLGTEIYFMSLTGDITIVPYASTILTPSGKSETSRGTNSVIGIKCINAGSAPSTEATWVLFGDLADA